MLTHPLSRLACRWGAVSLLLAAMLLALLPRVEARPLQPVDSTLNRYQADCAPLTVDVYYVLDASASMAEPFSDGMSKMQAAKSAVVIANGLLEEFENESRAALMSYQASTNGTGLPPTYATYNDYWSYPTSDIIYLNSLLSYIGALGHTPTSHALRFIAQQIEFEQGSHPSHIPMIILVTDGVPTVSYEGSLYNGYYFQSQHVTPISVKNEDGTFRTAEEVREDGIYYAGYDLYSGEPLADLMESAVALKALVPETIIHVVAVQSLEGSYNGSVLEYVAWQGEGAFEEANTATELSDVLEEIIIDTACPAPSAVYLDEFAAKNQADQVQLTWDTTMEMNNLGFNLYRSWGEGAPEVQLNAALIPSLGPNSGQGFHYEWQDPYLGQPTDPTRPVYYWLEDVDTSGRTTLHGPIMAKMPVTLK